MKNHKNTYPAIREIFGSLDELCEYLGRGQSYVSQCLNGQKDFTPAEKIAISVKVGQPWEVIACM